MRPQAQPAGLDAADLHRPADGGGDARGDLVAMALDLRQEPVAQAEEGEREYEKSGPGKRLEPPRQPPEGEIGVQKDIILIDLVSVSRYAARLLGAHPGLGRDADAAAPPFGRDEMLAALARPAGEEEAAFKRRLRELRNRVMLRVMARDLAGQAPLEEVCATLSELAELEIAACLRWLGAQSLVVVAMGKLGGRELNASSDIDLVLLHPDAREAERLEGAARRLVRLLAEPTEDGFAFRVDLRLRPYGESGPLVASFDFLESYLVAHGREWERYAWIKARPLSGGADAALAAIVQPFVFRKYLDYATLSAMRGLHAEVRRDVERRELADDVKLGPGGIREIEFIAQALQLVRGGREPELRARPTLQVLERLARKSLIPEAAGGELREAYVFLRRLEHCLQYLDDAQRHELPRDEEDRRRVARMMHCDGWPACAARLAAHRAAVTRHFESVLAERGAEAGEPWPRHPRLDALRASQRYALLPADSRARLDRVLPALGRAAARTPDPAATLARGVDLIEAIATRAAYLALLAEHPEALERVARILAASSWAAEFITRHPLLLDELLDERLLSAPPELDAVGRTLRAQLAAHPGDTERRLDILRETHQAQVFRLLTQDLAGLLTVERLADHLSALADLMLEATLECAWDELPRRHREGPPRFAVIAYGKLGGKELGYASDLDIIFLYDDAAEAAGEVYARLAQRLNRWLTSRTPSGILFETDLELRPSGASGLLVSTVEAFARYQEREAWVWEHQALTRARFSAGDRAVGAAFEAIRERILTRERNAAQLAREIAAMREKLHAAHPNRSGLFDVKHDTGGMIDIEFSVQFLVLAHAARFAGLTRNLGNIALLGMAGELGLIDRALAARCQAAYREYRRRQHALRLNGAAYARVPPAEVAAHVAAVGELWSLSVRAAL
ncbi:MAG TPA: bifunctional [glutamate--ammonia ligase]-adenylyl-L-tyrosine phosphorylase/[glutamate--ammonia-ligase] adenylyltransferase [Burkholderiales bacterium]|nr:bifunctional [glutamate--ammonia ligase]-adenylyl-L-tyrosine phosphorylase/[glutamate--ammonia-ligase] adenylyltransferase [Burkholderiales bacterium]